MIGIYTRLSIEDGENSSIQNQLREGITFANGKPYEVYDEGQGISGRSEIKDRPELDRLLKDIATDKITTVWMRNQNRLERNSITFHIFADLAKKHRTKVVFGNKVMDWNDPSNFLQSSILTAINSYQAGLQSYQTKKTLSQHAQEGKVTGLIPYGYTSDENSYIVLEPIQSEIVKRIYELSLSGMGLKTIANTFNDEGIETKRKTTWRAATVSAIIKNSHYKGERFHGGKMHKVPSIVEPSYWQRVNDNLVKNRVNTGKPTKHKYLLKNLLKCGKCGRGYFGRRVNNRPENLYSCSSRSITGGSCGNRSINITALETFVWESMFESDTLYNKMVDTFKDGGTDKRRKELSKLIASHQKELISLENQRKRMVRAVLDGVLSNDEVAGERKRITRAENDYTERLKKDEEELYELNNETRILDDIAFDWGELSKESRTSLFKKGKERLRDGLHAHLSAKKRKRNLDPSFNEKSRLLKKYIKHLTIDYDKEHRVFMIEVTYTLPLPKETYLVTSLYTHGYNATLQKKVNWYYESNMKINAPTIILAQKRMKKYLGKAFQISKA